MDMLNADHLQRIQAALSPLGIEVDEFQYLITGANSAVYKLRCRNRDQALVAKVGIQPRFRRLDLERDVLARFSELTMTSGRAPAPVAYCEEASSGLQTLVVTFVEGRHPFDCFESHLENMGRTVAAYHGIVPSDNLIPEEDGRLFLKKRVLDLSGVSNPLTPRFQHALESVSRIADSDSGSIDSDDPSADRSSKKNRSVIVHGDLIPNNMIINKEGKLTIIDWEGARVDAPEADLATLFKAFHLRGESLRTFLSGYGLPVNPQRLWFRSLLHYLQVIAWRLKCQIPEAPSESKTAFQQDCEQEMVYVETALELGKDPNFVPL